MDRTLSKSGNFVCANIYISGTASHHCTFKFQSHNRGPDRTGRILQAEEQILEHVEEELDISTRQLAAAVGAL